MPKNEIKKFDESEINDKIYSIRGYQVMLDRDLAELYGVETKRINEAVKRNKERFPLGFCFQLNNREIRNIRSQFATLENQQGKHKKYLPFVFTEQGVAMLAGILKSDVAVKISIQIIEAFVAMRKFISSNAILFNRMDNLEIELHKTNKKVDKVFNALESKDIIPKKKIFFDKEIFDAYNFVTDIFKSAKKSILIIDNYIDDSVLIHLSDISPDVKVKILTKSISEKLKQAIGKFSAQYFPVEVELFKKSHDRFIIVDNSVVYHFGASLKDLGKKWFAFSRYDKSALELMSRLVE